MNTLMKQGILSKQGWKQGWRRRLAGVAMAALGVLAMPGTVQAQVELRMSDAGGTSAFAERGAWSNGEAPRRGGQYVVSGRVLRSPTEPREWSFAGDTLTLRDGGVFLTKSNSEPSRFTFPGGLVLDGGVVRNGNNAPSVPTTLAGLLRVTPAGGQINITNEAVDIAAAIDLEGPLSYVNLERYAQKRTSLLSGAVRFRGEGRLIIAQGVRPAHSPNVEQDRASVFTFVLGAGAEPRIAGGTKEHNELNLGGSFVFDRSQAPAGARSWKIVDAQTLTVRHLSTFTVRDFSKRGSLWVSNDGAFEYDTTTGVLSRR
ncbi:MAG: hypothetical protein MUE42_03300 [Opitutaceae bacterium]|nr:hypothetical protein [Opitutaceae bacterium]